MLQVDFNRTTARLIFSHPDMPAVAIREASALVRFSTQTGRLEQVYLTPEHCSIQVQSFTDIHGAGSQKIIQCSANPLAIELTYTIKTYPKRPFVLFQLSIHNRSRESFFLRDFCLLQVSPTAGGNLQIDVPPEGLKLLKLGWLGWSYTGIRTVEDRNTTAWLDRLTRLSYANPVTPRPNNPGEFWSEGWTVLVGGTAALVAGFVSTARQFGQVYTCIRPGETALTLTTQLDGIRLDPGEIRDSEWGYLQFAPLPNPEPQADFVEAVARQMQARLLGSPPPPMWTHWYQFYHDISEQRFLDNLDLLLSKRETIPYQVAELDDGYQAAWGDWLATNDRFPHGLAWLSEQITAQGFTPGLWLAPFVVERKSRLAQQHPDWLVKDKHGKDSRAGFLYNKFAYALDLTNPQVLEHLRKLIATLTQQWGYRMLKIDFLNTAVLPGSRYDAKCTRAEALRSGLEVIRQAAGEDSFLLGCGCPFGPAIGIVDAMRIGPDTAPSWEPYFNWLSWVGPLIRRNPSMPSLRNALRNTLYLGSLHQRWWWNDPDCLLVREQGSRLSAVEVQSAVSLIGLSGGMLVSSDNLGGLSAERLRWVSVLVPNLALRGLPLDTLQREMPTTYLVRQEKYGQTWQLVALFNWDDYPRDLHLRLSDLGYSLGAELHIFDFWDRQYQRVSQPKLVFSAVPAHGCKLLRVCQVDDALQLVGDTLHISMGAEIETICLEGTRLVIEMLDLGRKLDGELWFWSSQAIDSAICAGEPVEVIDRGGGIFTLPLRLDAKG